MLKGPNMWVFPRKKWYPQISSIKKNIGCSIIFTIHFGGFFSPYFWLETSMWRSEPTRPNCPWPRSSAMPNWTWSSPCLLLPGGAKPEAEGFQTPQKPKQKWIWRDACYTPQREKKHELGNLWKFTKTLAKSQQLEGLEALLFVETRDFLPRSMCNRSISQPFSPPVAIAPSTRRKVLPSWPSAGGMATPLKTDIAPENWWFEFWIRSFPFQMAFLQVRTVSFREGIPIWPYTAQVFPLLFHLWS